MRPMGLQLADIAWHRSPLCGPRTQTRSLQHGFGYICFVLSNGKSLCINVTLTADMLNKMLLLRDRDVVVNDPQRIADKYAYA